MSIFTKILIVLVMILAVVLSALVVPFVVNQESYKFRWLDAVLDAEVARANERNRHADLAQNVASLNATIEQLKGQVAKMTAEVNQRDTSIQEKTAQIIELQNKDADIRAQLARLSVGLKQATQVNEVLQAEIKDRRDSMLRLQVQLVEVSDSLRQKTTEADTLLEQVKLGQEKVAGLTKLVESLETRKGPELASDSRLKEIVEIVVPPVQIRGRVIEVRDMGENTYLAINVGSQDKVQENMLFMIHQGDRYVGDLLITKVDANASAGRVTMRLGKVAANMEVQAGPAQQ